MLSFQVDSLPSHVITFPVRIHRMPFSVLADVAVQNYQLINRLPAQITTTQSHILVAPKIMVNYKGDNRSTGYESNTWIRGMGCQ